MTSAKSRDFIAGYGLGRQMVQDYQAAQNKQKMAEIGQAKEVTENALTEEQANQIKELAGQTNEDGTPKFTIGFDGANKYTAMPTAPTGAQMAIGGAAPDGQASVAAPAVEPFITSSKPVTSFLGKTYDQPLTDSQRDTARMRAMASVYDESGDPARALQLRSQATAADMAIKQGALTDLHLAQAQRAGARDQQGDTDSAKLRALLAGGGSVVPAGDRNAALRSTIGTGADITGASGTPEHVTGDGSTPPGKAPEQATSQAPGQAGQSPDDLAAYMERSGPAVIKLLVSQGKFEEAKRYSDFTDSEAGKKYATLWTQGMRAQSVGDYQGAIGAFERLYNNQHFNDGQTVKMTPVADGKYQVSVIGADGKVVGSKVLDQRDISQQAGLLLNPVNAVAFHAQQESKRASEESTLDRQLQLETLRQKGREVSEDRRDERLVKRLASGAGGRANNLTLTQQRSNAEIDAARDQVAGLDQAEIQRRTAKTTDTGRENPDFDPTLARASSLANRRKVGDDQEFDGRSGSVPTNTPEPAKVAAPAAAQVNRQDVATRFRSDKSMNLNRLGRETPKGVEVLNSAGKLLGYYR